MLLSTASNNISGRQQYSVVPGKKKMHATAQQGVRWLQHKIYYAIFHVLPDTSYKVVFKKWVQFFAYLNLVNVVSSVIKTKYNMLQEVQRQRCISSYKEMQDCLQSRRTALNLNRKSNLIGLEGDCTISGILYSHFRNPLNLCWRHTEQWWNCQYLQSIIVQLSSHLTDQSRFIKNWEVNIDTGVKTFFTGLARGMSRTMKSSVLYLQQILPPPIS